MNPRDRHRVLARTAVVWSAVTATSAAVAWSVVPIVGGASNGPAERDFADALVDGCAVAAALSAGWLWLIATDVAVSVLRAGNGPARRQRSSALRLVLLSLCGVAALGATATPAVADDRPGVPVSLSGLPLPDRTSGWPARRDDDATVGAAQVRVRAGDSLWVIAQKRLGRAAPVDEVDAYWRRVYARNRAEIGPDPDQLVPGQLLDLPPD